MGIGVNRYDGTPHRTVVVVGGGGAAAAAETAVATKPTEAAEAAKSTPAAPTSAATITLLGRQGQCSRDENHGRETELFDQMFHNLPLVQGI
jgi:succinate dehydrogenase/fumarate reductase flavoprotein subunit